MTLVAKPTKPLRLNSERHSIGIMHIAKYLVVRKLKEEEKEMVCKGENYLSEYDALTKYKRLPINHNNL